MNSADQNNAPSGKPGFFARLKAKLSRAPATSLSVQDWLTGRTLDDELEEEIEERLLMADAGIAATARIIKGLKKRAGGLFKASDMQLRDALRAELRDILRPRAVPLTVDAVKSPFVILMVGVNGSGKTTTIGKLAHHFKQQGKSILLAAGDTFRAAATEQLQTWGERNNVPVIAQIPGADPAAVIFDALQAAESRGTDIVLADTAGRLQNQEGLMRELQKVVRIAGKFSADAPHEIMLVLDASLGQNALIQARQFHAAVGITGITLTKLDGGARGGILLAIADEMEVPIRFIGIGEQADDMAPFDADRFVDALLDFSPGLDSAAE